LPPGRAAVWANAGVITDSTPGKARDNSQAGCHSGVRTERKPIKSKTLPSNAIKGIALRRNGEERRYHPVFNAIDLVL
ncbi:MAG: hypothetical protein ACKVON_15160, partial [Beijerinckiaceae bacterium]